MTKKNAKKKTKRSRSKYPALDPSLNIKIRYEEIADFDYINKLNEEEKAWLNKFNSEYINDQLDRKNLKNNLHNTKELKKSCDDRNNSRNRDIMSKSKIINELVYLEDLKINNFIELEDSKNLQDNRDNSGDNSEESDEL